MDIVELNKLTQRKRYNVALDHLYEVKKLTVEDSVVLIAYGLKKQFGVIKAIEILHGIGVKDLKV